MECSILMLLLLSAFITMYTYGLYPLILLLLPRVQRKNESESTLSIHVFIVSKLIGEALAKRQKLEKQYGDISISVADEYSKIDISKSRSDLIVFTDSSSDLAEQAITKLAEAFVDGKVGLAVGLMRRQCGVDGQFHDSAYWRYENKVRYLEGKIGAVSGANSGLYAIRRELIHNISANQPCPEFSLSVSVAEQGFDSVFVPEAVAYEKEGVAASFQAHVHSASDGFRFLFAGNSLSGNHLFVYISHRVMKLLVPLALLLLILLNLAILLWNADFAVLLILQLIGYSGAIFHHLSTEKYRASQREKGRVLMAFGMVDYFLTLNLAIAAGFCHSLNCRECQRK